MRRTIKIDPPNEKNDIKIDPPNEKNDEDFDNNSSSSSLTHQNENSKPFALAARKFLGKMRLRPRLEKQSCVERSSSSSSSIHTGGSSKNSSRSRSPTKSKLPSSPPSSPSNLSILDDLNHSAPTTIRPQGDSLKILQDLQSTNDPTQRRQCQAASIHATNSFLGCGIREKESVDGMIRQYKGVGDDNILEDLAAAEDEWMDEYGHRIII